MKMGYARVSSNTQDLELQKQELFKFGCEQIFSGAVSSKDNNRSQLRAMIELLRAKDVVVVYKIDRIARSLKGLIEMRSSNYFMIKELISLDLGDRVDITSPMNKAFFQIAGVFAELEPIMINQRTKAGIKKAIADGIKFGRAKGSTDKNTSAKLERIKIFLEAKKSYDWISKELGVSKKTIASVKKSSHTS